MGRFIRPVVTMVLALSVRPGPAPEPAAATAPVQAQEGGGWYVPRAEDFRPPYDRDLANGGKQTWEQYWGWVRLFYDGNFFTKGWDERARWLVEEIRSDAERRRLCTRLNALGRDICAEWSKDYEVRKVGSADVLTWGKRLEKARAAEDGSGAELHRALDEIREHHRKKVGATPP